MLRTIILSSHSLWANIEELIERKPERNKFKTLERLCKWAYFSNIRLTLTGLLFVSSPRLAKLVRQIRNRISRDRDKLLWNCKCSCMTTLDRFHFIKCNTKRLAPNHYSNATLIYYFFISFYAIANRNRRMLLLLSFFLIKSNNNQMRIIYTFLLICRRVTLQASAA